jgi:dephospho-CoA kinase
MVYLIAVAGHTGAGKTTAVCYLKEMCGGEVVYLGGAVLDYMNEHGISITPESELLWRLKLREQDGPGAFAMLKSGAVTKFLEAGMPVYVDAIFAPQEFEILSSRAGQFRTYLVGINASFTMRCERLRSRPKRPFSEQDVMKRDQKEIEELGTGEVLASAMYTISNEGSLADFHESLSQLMRSMAADSPKI